AFAFGFGAGPSETDPRAGSSHSSAWSDRIGTRRPAPTSTRGATTLSRPADDIRRHDADLVFLVERDPAHQVADREHPNEVVRIHHRQVSEAALRHQLH